MMLCDIDGSILTNSKSVYNHNKVHLNDDHHCEICYKTFSTLEFLKKHKKRTHTDAVYECNECDEQFKVQTQESENRGKRFFYVIRDFYDENHTDRTKFKKKNCVRRRL